MTRVCWSIGKLRLGESAGLGANEISQRTLSSNGRAVWKKYLRFSGAMDYRLHDFCVLMLYEENDVDETSFEAQFTYVHRDQFAVLTDSGDFFVSDERNRRIDPADVKFLQLTWCKSDSGFRWHDYKITANGLDGHWVTWLLPKLSLALKVNMNAPELDELMRQRFASVAVPVA